MNTVLNRMRIDRSGSFSLYRFCSERPESRKCREIVNFTND